jgi:hypothetical protein
MRAETCSVCGEECRWGQRPDQNAPTRPGSGFWMHRDPATDADHRPKFGYLADDAFWASIEAQLDEPRVKEDGTVYTTRSWKTKGKADEAEGDDQELVDERKVIPPPEVWAQPLEKGEEHWPGGCTTITNLLRKHEWYWKATYSRGPRVHASHGTLLGMSDYVVLRMALDGSDRRAVGFWVDTKFDHAWLARLDAENGRYVIEPYVASSNQLKAWIRGEDV